MDTDISKEMLGAFVDGELSPQEMERVVAILAERPDLESYVRRQERLRTDLRGAFTPILEQPLPVRVIDTVRSAPLSLRWRLRHMLPGLSWSALVPVVGAALAVGLVVGFVLQPAADWSTNASGQLVAQGSLARALDRQLAAAAYAGSGPRIGISYRDKAGEDCRTFINGAASGLACHRKGAWVIGTLVNAATVPPGYVYRMAGSAMPDAVRNAVTADIVGAPFDAHAERAARDSGWK